jgi:hypothetical protein
MTKSTHPPSAPGPARIAPAKPTGDPEAPPKKSRYARWLALLGFNSLFLSIAVHSLFAVVATYLVVEHFQKKHINFHATEPPSPHNEVEHKVQLANKNKVDSAPPDLKRITSTDLSPITLPDVPTPPQTEDTSPTEMSGVGVDALAGPGGSGGGGGPGGGGDMTLFGSTEGTGLSGYLYDLKQTADKKDTGMNLPQYYQVLGKYLAGGWDESVLEAYYKSKSPLIADRIAISTRLSGEAPKAFNLENEVQPGLWVVHYHGKVSAPQAGDYHFLGFADNVLAVRIAGQIVLDAGWNNLTNDPRLKQPSDFAFPSYVTPAQQQGRDAHLRRGVSFHMDAGQFVDMDVLIGDDGGKCSFFLQVQNEAKTYDGSPAQYPFFQLGGGDAPNFSSDEEFPPFTRTQEPWQASSDSGLANP